MGERLRATRTEWSWLSGVHLRRRLAARLALVVVTVVILDAAATLPSPARMQDQDPVPAYLAQVDADRLTLVATDLVTRFGPRHQSLFSPFLDDQCTPSTKRYPKNNLDMASDYMRDAFEVMGYPVELEPVRLQDGGTGYNVVATKVGAADPDTYIEVGAHIDSVVGTPGAGDNASGATALVEIARVLADYESGYSIRFIAHVGEEKGQTGSSQHLDGVLRRGERIKMGLIMDGIGWSEIAPEPMNCIWANEDPESTSVAHLFDAVRTDYGLEIDWRLCTPSGQTADNAPYWNRGFPAVLSIGGLPYTAPGYHGCGDTMDTVDMQNVLLITKQNLAVLLRLDAEAETVWRQSDWSGGAGQHVWADASRFSESTNIYTGDNGSIRLAQTAGGEELFADDFERPPDTGDLMGPWTVQTGSFTVTNGYLANNVPPRGYALVHNGIAWHDYSVSADVKMPDDGFAACIGGRLDVATGEQYATCLYATGRLTLINLNNWQMAWDLLAEVNMPAPDTDWHELRLSFSGAHAQVHFDGKQRLEVANDLYAVGAVSLFTWTGEAQLSASGAAFDNVAVRSLHEHALDGSLVSSAFDGGAGAVWGLLSWTAQTNDDATVHVRTRTADHQHLIADATWSRWMAAGGSPVTSADKRWIQYEITLASDVATVTPVVQDVSITYVPGSGNPPNVTPSAAFLPMVQRAQDL